MAHVDLARDTLVLKVVLAGPPAVGKTARLEQLAAVGREARFGTSVMGPQEMAILPLRSERGRRKVEIEVYEWHGRERADVRAKGLFVGLDGLIYIADARADRLVDTVRQLEFLAQTAGMSKLRRLPSLLLLGHADEGELRLASIEPRLNGPIWSDRLEMGVEEDVAFVERVRVYGEVMLARLL